MFRASRLASLLGIQCYILSLISLGIFVHQLVTGQNVLLAGLLGLAGQLAGFLLLEASTTLVDLEEESDRVQGKKGDK